MSIVERVGAKAGDLIFFGAGRTSVNESMAALRDEVAEDQHLYTQDWAAHGSLTFLCLKMMVVVV